MKVYVLKSLNWEKYYIGISDDLDRRLQEHNSGKTKSIKAFAPWKLIYWEEFQTHKEAREREKYFKSGSGREYLKNLKLPG